MLVSDPLAPPRAGAPRDVVEGTHPVAMGASEVRIPMDGWRVDWSQTKAATAEKFFFSPDGTGGGLAQYPGFTHVQRQCKRTTGMTTWKLVNKQPRTTDRRAAPRAPKAARPEVPAAAGVRGRKRRKPSDEAERGSAVGTVADL